MRATLLGFLVFSLLVGLAPAQPPAAMAENYGHGSVLNNTSTPGAILMPPATTAFRSNMTRGYFFTAPVAFYVLGLQVPDVDNLGFQSVALYRLQAGPPAFSQTVQVEPVFFRRWAPSNAMIRVLPPVVFNQGDVFAVLGACSNDNDLRMISPYGMAQPSVNVGGVMTTLYRCGMQHSIAAASGDGANGIGPLWSEVNGSISRVDVDIVAFQHPFPRLDTAALPILGTQARLDLGAGISGANAGLIVLGVGRVSLPTNLGTVLAGLPWVASFVIPGASGPQNIPIPNDPVLSGGIVNWQGFAVAPTNFGTSNGVEWRIGL